LDLNLKIKKCDFVIEHVLLCLELWNFFFLNVASKWLWSDENLTKVLKETVTLLKWPWYQFVFGWHFTKQRSLLKALSINTWTQLKTCVLLQSSLEVFFKAVFQIKLISFRPRSSARLPRSKRRTGRHAVASTASTERPAGRTSRPETRAESRGAREPLLRPRRSCWSSLVTR